MIHAAFKSVFRYIRRRGSFRLILAATALSIPLTAYPYTHADSLNYTHTIPLNDVSTFRLVYTEDPVLDIFHGSIGAFYEIDPSVSSHVADGPFYTDARLFAGVINIPRMIGPAMYNGSMRSDLERSILLYGSQLGIGFSELYRITEQTGMRFGVRTDGFLRLAYNVYDLMPSIEAISNGSPVQDVFANHFSGMSYSTIQNRISTEVVFLSGEYQYGFSYSTELTDFIYNENAAGISFSKQEVFGASLFYDWASYDYRNGVAADGIRGRIELRRDSSVISFEGGYRADGTIEFGIYGTVAIGVPNKKGGPVQSDHDRGPENIVTAGTAGKVEIKIDDTMMEEAKAISWDETLLRNNGMSIEEIGAVLKAHNISDMYDYSRVTGLDYTDMRTPEEYIAHGGICRDAANTVANILVSNGYEAKIVYSKQAAGTPHAFVVTKDHGGNYFIFDYDDIYKVSGSTSLGQTAGSYSKSLVLLLMDPQTHRITDLIETPDAEYLDRVAGMRRD